MLILITSSHDNVWISLGENCCFHYWDLKGENDICGTTVLFFFTFVYPSIMVQ